MKDSFSRLPTWWIHNSETNNIIETKTSLLQDKFTTHGNNIGDNIATLKCYLALISSIHYSTGISNLTYSEIEDIAGLSRPMVSKGLQILQEMDLIQIHKNGRRNSYQFKLDFLNFNAWAKTPTYILRNNLSDIPSKGIISLVALKIYLLLLSIRKKEVMEVSASYEYLTKNCSIQRKHIKKALVLLALCGFIDIAKTTATKSEYSHNIFKLRGICI